MFKSGEIKNGVGTYIYPNDGKQQGTYCGDWKENKRHGFGKIIQNFYNSNF